MIVAIIAGARPNFMKVAPIIKAIQEARSNDQDIDYRLIHTGQQKVLAGNIITGANYWLPRHKTAK